jgi:hypothetical protein
MLVLEPENTRIKDATTLLFYLTRKEDPHKELIAAAFSWMAKESGYLFESYFPGYSTGAHYPYPWPFHSHHGERYGVGPFQGEGHAEQFYFLSNLFDLTVIRTEECLRFAYESRLFSLREIIEKEDNPLCLLEKVRNYLKTSKPQKIIVLGEKTNLKIEPYVYPEIFFASSWGLKVSTLLNNSASILKNYGSTIYGLYLSSDEEDSLKEKGFKIVVIDKINEGESYNDLTIRIAERWKEKGKAIAYADPYQAEHYIPYNCQEKILTIFNRDIMGCVPPGPEAIDGWNAKRLEEIERGFIEKIAHFAKIFPSKIVYGRQATDNLITDLSKYGFVFPVFDPHRPIFPIKRKIVPRRLPGTEHSIFGAQRDREQIKKEIINENKIPVVFLTYSADLRHISGLRNFLEVVALRKIPCGLTLNAFWFIHHPEWLQELFIPFDQGGVFPLIEPLLGSAGWGLCCAAEGYVEKDTLKPLLISALKAIEEYTGKENLPGGLYPFQDANPEYIGQAETLFSAYKEAGLKFCFTQKDYNTFPHIVYQEEDFVALNQPLTFFPSEFFQNPVKEVHRWEEEIVKSGRPGYITAVFDFPLWFQSPYILDMGQRLLSLIDYVKGGGDSGRLIPVHPSELAEYARMTEL